MTEKRVIEQHHATFESIRQFDADGVEYWIARRLAKVLEYSEYRHFQPVIERAREACRNSGHSVEDHFEDVLDMVEIGSGAKRQIADIRLSQIKSEQVRRMHFSPVIPECFYRESSLFIRALLKIHIPLLQRGLEPSKTNPLDSRFSRIKSKDWRDDFLEVLIKPRVKIMFRGLTGFPIETLGNDGGICFTALLGNPCQ